MPPRRLTIVINRHRRWRLPIVWLWPVASAIALIATALAMTRHPRLALGIPHAVADLGHSCRGLQMRLGRYRFTVG